ncbi:VOC family protein [Janibacter cremeus]|uniref:Catechol 2,3-dioxygenase-like lactoylglutathione lyase family enzyme n=1 Tax=Janibacter cremeus TaxID=1285192 RepID=A0A852VPR4_9MICO|nr:VOC family protein [Janibacter cremeus]NYF98176.1 catechol 2,3-dioxygenase-like lactoylglutathione lyase family enzyme [Janibacter cremeus]
MEIIGLTVTAPDVAATEKAWQRLGPVGVSIEVIAGEPGMATVTLGVDDVPETERLLRRRGLVGDAAGFDLGGTTWRLAPTPGDEGGGPAPRVDHVVVVTGDPERAAANFGARLGLDLRLDRQTGHGFRGLFFRCGDAVVEVIVPSAPPQGPDTFGGVAWRVADLDTTRTRLARSGVELSPVREGRKPGTRVTTVRDPDLAVPTLLLASA